ncbi:MAG TPA: GAF domain-containing protein [Candidatus Dormibacteraeota bacterium]|nr:GAF domain-containing protein [Candidatus Dormibacteraeota bacterium]
MAEQSLLDLVPAALVSYDADGVVVDANAAALGILGLSKPNLVGTNAEDAEWLIVESPDAPPAAHPVIAALKGRQPIRGVLVKAHRPDGSDAWLQVDVVPLEGEPPDGVRAVATLTDVTHLISRSRVTSRSAGDHIVDEVTDRLAHTRMDPKEILTTLTKSLSVLRPGIWVASLIGKNPSNVEVVAVTNEDPDYLSGYLEAMQVSGSMNSTPISSSVIESGQPLLLEDVSIEGLMDHLNDEIRGYLTTHPWLSPISHLGVIVVPMHARGATIGTLGLFERRGSNPLTQKDQLWIQSIADRAGLAVENAQLYEDAVKRLERLAALQSVSLAVSASPDLRLTLKVILDHVTTQLKVDAADVLLLDEADATLTLAASTGFLATAVPDYRLPVDEGMPGRAVNSRRIETMTGLSAFSQFRRRSLFAREGFKAYGAVPLFSRGKLLGALEVFHRSQLSPDEEWLGFLDALGSVAAVAIDSAALQERLRQGRPGDALRRTSKAAPEMSRLEREIMRLAVGGMTNREIASQVHLSQNTVKFHMRQILQKAGVSNRTELAHQVAKEGWL